MTDPFFRWAGGKRQLLPVISENLPDSYNRYFEPFLGGGAVYFYLERANCCISDTNNDLIAAYSAVKDNLPELLQILQTYKERDCETFYNEVKNMDLDLGYKDLPPVQRGARFIYLTKTCFNGLYRVNSQGHFNKAYAHIENPNICDVQGLLAANRVLSKGTEIINAPYDHLLDKVSAGDFVYMDPPYDPVSKTANFVSYTKDGFSREDQIKLKDFVDELNRKNVQVMLSNNWTDFIVDLWKDYRCLKIDVRRNVAGDPEARGMVNEILITNYEPTKLFEF